MEKIKEVKAIKYKNKEFKEVNEKIIKDENINLQINNLPPRKFSTYPENLEDFVIGYLLGEGLINKIDDIKKIEKNGKNINIRIKLTEIDKEGGCILSDCGGGWRSEIKKITPVKSNLKINAIDILKNMERLKKEAPIWKQTGGAHVAQIIYKDKYIIREDVSRHVAVDKVIGAATRKSYDLSKSYITYSGRMPSDMVIKIIRVGIPILISNAAPSNSGYEIAEKGNVTMIGFVRGNRFNIYTNPNRINLN